jgi:hypothetical protein
MRSMVPDSNHLHLQGQRVSEASSTSHLLLLVSHLTYSSVPKVKKNMFLWNLRLCLNYNHITTQKIVLILYSYVRYLSEYQAPHALLQEVIEKKIKLFQWQPCYLTLTKEKLIEFHIFGILFWGPTNSGGPPQKSVFYVDTTNAGNWKIQGLPMR